MPRIAFDKVADLVDRPPLPAGEYLCEVVEVEVKTASKGDEMWRLRLVVLEGEYEGRLVFDNLVFSNAALPRVKFICSQMGLDVSQERDLLYRDIVGKSCYVTVGIKEYQDLQGLQKERNAVQYDGYRPSDGQVPQSAVAGTGAATSATPESDVPF